MKKISTPEYARRREFLGSLAVAGGVVLLLGGGAALAGTEPQPADEQTPAGAGYHETEHMRDYYRLARQ